MASESIVVSQQQTSSPPQSLIYAASSNEKISSAANSATDAKNDSGSEKVSRNSSSCDEDWTGEFGKLVIDLDNDNDVDKSNKEMKPFVASHNSNNGSETPVRNNNNNNSVSASSPSNNKHVAATEKSVSANKNASSGNVSKGLSSYTQNASQHHSSKNGKTKSKKSSKSSKSHASASLANSSSHFSGSRVSSPTVPFNSNAEITSNVNSTKHGQNYDSKPSLSRTSSSPDDVAGKKSKSLKSKSHHKKHKHGEKTNSGSTSSKTEMTGEKTKSKSKHSSNPQTSTTSMPTFSTSSGAHNLPAHVSGVTTSLAVANKTSSGFRRSASPSLAALTNVQPTSNAQKYHQTTIQGRTPTRTALISTSAGSGVKTSHACNEKDPSSYENTSSIHGGGHGRKKQRKSQTAIQSYNSNQTAATNSTHSEPSDSDSQQLRGYSIQQANAGKRERNNGGSSQISNIESSGSKKIKLDSEVNTSIGSDNRNHSATANLEGNMRPVVNQLVGANIGNNKTTSTPTRSPHSPPVNAPPDIGEMEHSKAGSKASDSGGGTVAPPVFAPSSIFAHSMPRYTATSGGVYANSIVTSSSETSSVWSSGSHYSDVKSRCHEGSGPPVVNSHRSVGTVTSTSDIGVMTEPDALGPCEPGTSVLLDGIVWHETDTGVLVVNVTWRNRTYVGTLLDATKHDWAPPRLSDSDIDMELRGKNGRPKRARGGATDTASSRKSRNRGGAQSMVDDVKGSPSTTAKRRNKNSESENVTDNDGTSTPRSSAKRARLATSRGQANITQQLQQLQNERNTNCSNGGSGSSTCSSPVFIECPHPKCSKRYRHINGLKYHQAHAHLDFDENDIKDATDFKEEDEVVSDQTSSPPDGNTEAKLSDSEMGIKSETPTKAGDIVAMEIATVDAPSSGQQNNQVSKLTEQTTHKHFPNEVSPPDVDRTSADEKQCEQNQVYPIYTNTSSTNDINTSCPLKIPQTITTSVAGDENNHPRQPSNQPLVQETSAVDSESAQAVKTLLQLQDTDDQFLPGLTAPYSQDSPHPTLTLVSRSGPPMQDNIQTTHGYPAQFSHPQTFPINPQYPHSSDQVIQRSFPPMTSIAQAFPAPVQQPPIVQPTDSPRETNPHHQQTIVAPLSVIPPSTAVGVVMPVQGRDSDNGQTYVNAQKENFTSTSHASSHPSGVKMAKGKTVPIPVDPNHGLLTAPSSYAGAASPGNLPSSAKKQKRKKKLDGKVPPESEGHHPIKHEITHHSPQNPVVPSTSAYPIATGAAAALNSMAASFQNSQKSTQPKTNEPAVNISTAHIKPEPGLRLPPQQFAGRKVPGIVLPASSSHSQPSNNITVTGTFHPYPDPHKPQTAVSAQAQDRIHANRAASPPNSSSNRNNNNKLAGIHNNSRAVQDQPAVKPRIPQPNPTHSEGGPHMEHGSDGNYQARPRYNEPKQRPPELSITHQDIISMNKIQDKVESTIVNAYAASRQLVPRTKTTTPVPETQRQPDQPTPHSRPPSPIETRPAMMIDDRVRPREGTPVSRNRPPVDGVIDTREASPNPQIKALGENSYAGNPQAVYLSQFQQLYGPQVQQMLGYSGIGYIPHMDPAYHQAAVAAQLIEPRLRQQYEQYMQDFQKNQYFQQQHNEKKVRKPDPVAKEPPKPDITPKQLIQSPADQEKTPNWPHQHAKRHSTGSSSPFQNQNLKEKPQGIPLAAPHHPSPSSSHGRYKSPQPTAHAMNQPTTRGHSVAPANSSAPPSGSPHPRSDSIERGRPSIREEGRTPMRKPTTPPVRGERSPEKPKEGHPPGVYRSPGASPGHLQYYPAAYQQIFDPARPTYRGVPHYAVPGFPAGYVYPQSGTTIFPAQPGWPSGGQPSVPGGKSPPLKPVKERPPSDSRSPSREDHSRGRPEVKPRDPTIHYNMKDRRSREVPNLPVRKLSRSPDPKALVPISSRNSTPAAPPGVEHRPPSPPTQRHLHTHHHIHEGVPPYHPIIPSQYAYPGPTVMANTDAYPATYNQKRD